MTTVNGKIIVEKCPEFNLMGIDGRLHSLSDLCSKNTLILVFYPGGPIKPLCNKQFCDYRDNFEMFKDFETTIVGISNDSTENQKKFSLENEYPFLFLTDPDNAVAKLFSIKSILMLGNKSRAVFIINKNKLILYRYVEPTWLTRRGSTELVAILNQLKENKLI